MSTMYNNKEGIGMKDEMYPKCIWYEGVRGLALGVGLECGQVSISGTTADINIDNHLPQNLTQKIPGGAFPMKYYLNNILWWY